MLFSIVICPVDFVGLVLDRRCRRWAGIFPSLGRRYYICRMFSVIYDALIGHERWVDAGLMLSQRRKLWTVIELALARRLCVHWNYVDL